MKKSLQSDKKIPYSSLLMIVTICILFGANTAIIKISFEGFGVFASAGLRFFLASIILILWGKLKGISFKVKKADMKKIIIISLMFSLQFSSYALGISKSNASRAVLLLNLQPFFVLLLSHFFIAGDKITLKKTLGMFIGFCGIVILVIKKDMSLNFEPGDILVLLTALIWASNAVYMKTFIKNVSVFNITFYQILFSVPIFFTESFIFDDMIIKSVNTRTCFAIFYQAILTAFGFVAWNFLLKRYNASTLHSFIFIIPISGVFFSYLLLNEPLTFNILGAMVLIAAGISVTQYNHKKIIDI